MKNSKQSTAMLLLMSLMFGSSNVVFAENQDQLAPITVSGTAETKAQEGKDQVYLKNQVTEYKSKKEIEAYRGNSAGDLLAGFSGVYSGDVRNGGAIDPIIRGSWGQGRIPIIVDGTEQAVTVWRGFAGVSNRNYLDPFLISSVSVEKGSHLGRDLNSGADGTVRMTTLDVDDIVKPGQKWGVEVKTETATNSSKTPKYPYKLNSDYRTTAGQRDINLDIFSLYYRQGDRIKQMSGNRNKLFNDNAIRLATAYKGDKFEGLLAYAYRKKGNYYAGGHGDKKYGGSLTVEELAEIEKGADARKNDDVYIPYIGAIYKKKKEVPNTSYESKSILAKTKFKFNEDANLKFMYRHTKLNYGDIMPSRLYVTYQQLNDHTVLQWPEADVKQNAFNTEFNYNPKDNQYIDLTLGAYLVHNNSKTNTSGGAPADTLYIDEKFKREYIDNNPILAQFEKEHIPVDDPRYEAEMKKLSEAYFKDPTHIKNIHGIFNTQESQAQFTKDNHWGINISNRLELNPKLKLDVMANYRRETLDSSNVYALWDKYKDLENTDIKSTRAGNTYYSGIRKGRRNEFNAGFNFTYNPTDWLILNAGARYTHYKLRDTGLAEQIAQNKEFKHDIYRYFTVTKTLTADEIKNYKESAEQKRANGEELSSIEEKVLDINSMSERYKRIAHKKAKKYCKKGITSACGEDGWLNYFNVPIEKYKYSDNLIWSIGKDGEYHLENNPLFDGRITDEMLSEREKHPLTGVDSPCITQDLGNGHTKEVCPKRYLISYESNQIVKENYTSEELAELLKPKKGHAWSPSLGITALITDNARIYVRYNETNRMPSIFEGTTGFSANGIDFRQNIKPEKTKSFELGYVQDLTGIFPSLRRADFRLNYFHNTTHNIFDRVYGGDSVGFSMHQFDKRTLEGIEVQGRYDQGHFFGDLSVTYNIKNRICDKNQAVIDTLNHLNHTQSFNNYLSGDTKQLKLHPTCVNGGFREGYLRNYILPKYSIVGNLGFRALNEKLEMSTRLTYHTNVKDTYAKSMRDAGFGNPNVAITRWKPVFLIDAYINYQFNQDLSISLSGTNLTDRYYLDPYSKSAMPGPGRTIKFGLTAKF